MRRGALSRIAFAVQAALALVFLLFPFYWAVVTSLKTGAELFAVDYLPPRPAWQNYAAVFAEQPFARNILNSVLAAGLTVALSAALALGAAYALSRIRFAGRRALLFALLAVSMFPQVAVLSGLFATVRALGLYDNVLGLALAYLIFTLPFMVWVLSAFMAEIPREIEEAALVDGIPRRTIVTRVFLPLLAPALVTSGLLAFVAAWNEFLFALTLTLTDAARTVPVAIALISGASQYELPWGRIMAASVIVTVPLIALALVFQRRIVAGLTAGAVRG